ncbi:MAG: diguanylate cyclase domain-containing protein [Candidatus Malihini olakiniferum]
MAGNNSTVRWLTSLDNRHQFDIFLHETIAHSAFSGKEKALIVLDVDIFNKYNDIIVMLKMDKCLQTVIYTPSSMPCRKEDLIARCGSKSLLSF